MMAEMAMGLYQTALALLPSSDMAMGGLFWFAFLSI